MGSREFRLLYDRNSREGKCIAFPLATKDGIRWAYCASRKIVPPSSQRKNEVSFQNLEWLCRIVCLVFEKELTDMEILDACLEVTRSMYTVWRLRESHISLAGPCGSQSHSA